MLAEGPDLPGRGALSRCRLQRRVRGSRQPPMVRGVVSHAGSRLLADVADRTTLTGQLAEALAGLRLAAGPSRSGSGAGRHGGRGRRRREDDFRCCGAGGSGRVVRACGVGLDVLAVAQPARHRAAGCGRAGPGRGCVRSSGRSAPSSRASRSHLLERAGVSCPGW